MNEIIQKENTQIVNDVKPKKSLFMIIFLVVLTILSITGFGLSIFLYQQNLRLINSNNELNGRLEQKNMTPETEESKTPEVTEVKYKTFTFKNSGISFQYPETYKVVETSKTLVSVYTDKYPDEPTMRVSSNADGLGSVADSSKKSSFLVDGKEVVINGYKLEKEIWYSTDPEFSKTLPETVLVEVNHKYKVKEPIIFEYVNSIEGKTKTVFDKIISTTKIDDYYGWKTYKSTSMGFSFKYPTSYSVVDNGSKGLDVWAYTTATGDMTKAKKDKRPFVNFSKSDLYKDNLSYGMSLPEKNKNEILSEITVLKQKISPKLTVSGEGALGVENSWFSYFGDFKIDSAKRYFSIIEYTAIHNTLCPGFIEGTATEKECENFKSKETGRASFTKLDELNAKLLLESIKSL